MVVSKYHIPLILLVLLSFRSQVWNHFHTELDPRSIVHIWLPGSKSLPNVTASGYRALYSPDGLWYMDGLSVNWEKVS